MLHKTPSGLQQIFIRSRKVLEHHGIETVFHKLLVHGHELGDKRLKVVDGLVAQLQPVFIVGGHVSHLGLQLTVAVAQQLCHQTLWEQWISCMNTSAAPQLSQLWWQMSRYLHDDIRRDAVCQQLVQTGSNLQQPETKDVKRHHYL